MLLSVRKSPMLCWVGGLLALSCRGEMLPVAGTDDSASAAESGSAAPLPSAGSQAAAAGAPVLAGAGSGHEGRSGGVAGGGAPASAGASGGPQAAAIASPVAGASGSLAEAGAGGAAGSGMGRRRRGGSGAAAEGGGAGRRSPEQAMAQAGVGGAAEGCVQDLACQLQAPESTGDVHQDCVDRINQFREECACLPPLERWVEGEACADEMAKYDSGGGEAHAAFGDNICEGGSAQNECPGWRSETQIVSVCLQRMWDEGPPPMSDCTGSCFQTYGHFLNMTNQRMSKVACGFHQRDDGQIWSVQNFSR